MPSISALWLGHREGYFEVLAIPKTLQDFSCITTREHAQKIRKNKESGSIISIRR